MQRKIHCLVLGLVLVGSIGSWFGTKVISRHPFLKFSLYLAGPCWRVPFLTFAVFIASSPHPAPADTLPYKWLPPQGACPAHQHNPHKFMALLQQKIHMAEVPGIPWSAWEEAQVARGDLLLGPLMLSVLILFEDQGDTADPPNTQRFRRNEEKRYMFQTKQLRKELNETEVSNLSDK